MNSGRLIVLVGIDGSGKTTQAKLLVEDMKKSNSDVSYVWSRWEPTVLRPLIKKLKRESMNNKGNPKKKISTLKGKKRKLLNNPVLKWLWLGSFVIDYGIQLFFKIRIKLLKKQTLISDRIYYDSLIDQAINFKESKNLLLYSLNNFWMKLIFPEPQMVIYIDCPEEIAYARKSDLFTPNIEYLTDRRKLYLELADKYKWIIMDGTMPIDDIAVQIREKVNKQLYI